VAADRPASEGDRLARKRRAALKRAPITRSDFNQTIAWILPSGVPSLGSVANLSTMADDDPDANEADEEVTDLSNR